MNIQDTLNNLKQIGNEVIELQRKAKQARRAALEPFLEALAASGEVSIITVRGSTPAFNDGEPCEHSADFWVNIDQHYQAEVDQSGDFEELFEELQDPHTWNGTTCQYEDTPGAVEHNRKLCAEHGHVYDKPSDEIMQAIEAVIYDSIEEDFGTNYYVIFTLKDGKFVREEGDYDCGY